MLRQEFETDCYPDNARLTQLAQIIGHTDIAAIQVTLGLQSHAPFSITQMKLRMKYFSDKLTKINIPQLFESQIRMIQ